MAIDTEDVDARIRLSVTRLREWQWMSTLSTEPDAVLIQLRKEAKEIIALGYDNPKKARAIGKVLVAYNSLMIAVKEAIKQRSKAA